MARTQPQVVVTITLTGPVADGVMHVTGRPRGLEASLTQRVIRAVYSIVPIEISLTQVIESIQIEADFLPARDL